MGVFVRAVITGFGFSVGKAIYDRVSERFLGESSEESDDDDQPAAAVADDIDDAEPICDHH